MRNFAANMLAFAMGRRVEYYDQPTIREIARAAELEDYRISSFIRGVVTSAPFQMSTAPATAEAGADRGQE